MTTAIQKQPLTTPALDRRLDSALFPRGRSEVSREEFAAVLSRSRESEPKTPEQSARAGAEQFVAIALIQPLLKQLRDSNHAAPPFAPSSAEKQFQSLYDGQVAQRIVSSTQFPLVDRLARDLLSRGRPAAQPRAAAPIHPN